MSSWILPLLRVMAEDTPTAPAPAGEERAPDTETKPAVAGESAPETSQEKEAEKEKPSGKLCSVPSHFVMPSARTMDFGLVMSSTVILFSCVALECIANRYACLC